MHQEAKNGRFDRHSASALSFAHAAGLREDLLERLKAGKIYPPDKVEWALQHFFQDNNLSTLRELSLREAAEIGRATGRERV